MADEIKSRYEALTVPEFKSAIPTHLLGKLSEQERYLVETLSKMEQQNTWLITAVVKGSAAVVDLDIRQTKTEQWKDRLTSKWSLVAAAFALMAPIVLTKVVEHIWKKGP